MQKYTIKNHKHVNIHIANRELSIFHLRLPFAQANVDLDDDYDDDVSGNVVRYGCEDFAIWRDTCRGRHEPQIIVYVPAPDDSTMF